MTYAAIFLALWFGAGLITAIVALIKSWPPDREDATAVLYAFLLGPILPAILIVIVIMTLKEEGDG